MCLQATRLLAVCFIVCIVYLTPTVSQCTTKYCSDDDNDVGALTVMVSRLQGTVERQERRLKEYQDTLELQQSLVTKLENTIKENILTLDLHVLCGQ